MDFKNLIVYKKALRVQADLELQVLSLSTIDRNLKDHLRRASNSIILNIAEGSSRFSKADRKNFLVISRGSAFECAAVLDIIHATTRQNFSEIENTLEEISKMLFKMISTLSGARKEYQL